MDGTTEKPNPGKGANEHRHSIAPLEQRRFERLPRPATKPSSSKEENLGQSTDDASSVKPYDRNFEATREIVRAQEKVNKVQEELDKALSRATKAEGRIASLIAARDSALRDRESVIAQFASLTGENVALTQQVDMLRAENARLRAGAGSLPTSPEDQEDPDDPYLVLGLRPGFFDGMDEDQIKHAIKFVHRAQSLASHPDRPGNGVRDDKKFKKVTEAYNKLKVIYNIK